jgi:hypothetical protein
MLAACRGVLGIEDLDVVKDGGAGTDGGGDAPGDSLIAADVLQPPGAIDAGCQAMTGMACGMCRRNAPALMPAFAALDGIAKARAASACPAKAAAPRNAHPAFAAAAVAPAAECVSDVSTWPCACR